jgi:hypothetical protein
VDLDSLQLPKLDESLLLNGDDSSSKQQRFVAKLTSLASVHIEHLNFLSSTASQQILLK